MEGYSLPYLEAEALIAAMEVLNEQDTNRPMLGVFPRVGRPANLIKIRRMLRRASQVRHTSIGGRAMPVERGVLKEDYYEPCMLKVESHLTAEDLTLFAAADTALRANDVGPLAKSVIASADALTMEIAGVLVDNLNEERHRMMCEALLGTINYRIGEGPNLTVDYGLTALGAPVTPWDNVGATIVADLTRFISEFRAANDKGISPNTVFYGEDLYADYFLGNTEWKEFKKANPEYAIGFLRVAGGRQEADVNGTFTDRVFGLTWIKVEGTYLNLDKTPTKRWPSNKLVFANLGPRGAVPQWSMRVDQLQNPRPDVNVEIKAPVYGDDVKVFQIRAFDNGLPTFMDPQLIMPVEIDPA